MKIVYAEGGEGTVELETGEEERAGAVLEDAEVLQLARWAVAIERHYGKPMDIEWAKDGRTGELFIVQARPETVQARREAGALKTYELREKGPLLAEGLAVGDAIAAGPALRLHGAEEIDRFEDGAVLVTEITDPDWVPVMKRAAAIVTEHGGRTSHAAIVSRELGLPAIVGAAGVTGKVEDGEPVTVSCAEGDEGFVYDGVLAFEETEARPRGPARDPHQGDAQPRRPGRRASAGGGCPPTASGWRGWSSSSTTTSRSTRWRCSASTRSRTRTTGARSKS